jgi:hypothetical protein
MLLGLVSGRREPLSTVEAPLTVKNVTLALQRTSRATSESRGCEDRVVRTVPGGSS